VHISRASSLLQTGKKKKWGLSSVFGGGHSESKSPAPLPRPVSDAFTQSTLSLKRTQSGHIAGDRRDVPEPAPGAPVITLDPKKAKKEAERQAKELEKAKREAAERAQKERARAVMQKRNQLQQERKAAGATTEFEWSSVEAPKQPPPGPMPSGSNRLFGLGNTSVRSHAESLARPDAHVPGAGSSDGGSQASSSRQAPSAARSRLSHQSMERLYEKKVDDGRAKQALYDSRAKARRRDDDNDHSTSSLSVNKLYSPSTMTVGTIDSE
jgi:meiosis induction protein kinase IME2/SME1